MASVGEDWFIRLTDKDMDAGLVRVRVVGYHGNKVWTLQGHQPSYYVGAHWDAVEGKDFSFVQEMRPAVRDTGCL